MGHALGVIAAEKIAVGVVDGHRIVGELVTSEGLASLPADSVAPLAKYTLNRAARLTEAMKDSGVLAHVALSATRRALD